MAGAGGVLLNLRPQPAPLAGDAHACGNGACQPHGQKAERLVFVEQLAGKIRRFPHGMNGLAVVRIAGKGVFVVKKAAQAAVLPAHPQPAVLHQQHARGHVGAVKARVLPGGVRLVFGRGILQPVQNIRRAVQAQPVHVLEHHGHGVLHARLLQQFAVQIKAALLGVFFARHVLRGNGEHAELCEE